MSNDDVERRTRSLAAMTKDEQDNLSLQAFDLLEIVWAKASESDRAASLDKLAKLGESGKRFVKWFSGD